jgi:hypothetical protein
MEQKTERDFSYTGPVWPTVEHWAQEHDYVLKETFDSTRLYEKPHSLRRAMGRWMFEVSQHEGSAHVAGWIRFRFVHRLGTLFLVPKSVPLEHGFRMYWNRRKPRRDMNELLASLGQPPVH